MRVLIFTIVYQYGYGVSLVVKKHVEGLLSENDIEVFVATPNVGNSNYESDDFSIIKIGTGYNDVINAINSVKPDIVIAHTPPFFEHVARIDDVNIIKVAYDYGEPFPFLFTGYERRIREEIDIKKYRGSIPNFHVHITISEFIKRCSGFESSHIHYLGANHVISKNRISRIKLREAICSNGFIITSLSRIGEGESRYKGFDMLKILKQKLPTIVPNGDFTFVIMGRLAQGGDLIKKDLEQNGFHVFSNVDEDFKQEVLMQSNLFFSPSLWEGFNLPLVEAQYLGIPSMAFSLGAHPEVCPFHFGTVDEALRHIVLMHDNKNYQEWFSKICRNYVMNKFKWEHNTRQLVSVLRDAMEQKQRGQLCLLKERETLNIKTSALKKQAIIKHLERLGWKAEVTETFNEIFKVSYALDSIPKVSIIIPNKDHLEDLQKCISSILRKSTYKSYDITVVENGSTNREVLNYYNELENHYPNIIKVLKWDKPFNFSALNNAAVKNTKGEYLVFLNNDTEVITENWIEEMLMLCQRKDVGIVGAKLYYPDNTIQHGGIILGIKGVSGHSHRHFPRISMGYMKRLSMIQNPSAVTGACLMTKRSVFEEVNGFDENLAVAFNDVDFCLKVRQKGYLVLWTPYAELYHDELKTRGSEDTVQKQARFSQEVKYMRSKWGPILDNDPYYNPNLTRDKEDFSIRV